MIRHCAIPDPLAPVTCLVDETLPPILEETPEYAAFLIETPGGSYWVICRNDPVNNVDPLGLETVWEGMSEYGAAGKAGYFAWNLLSFGTLSKNDRLVQRMESGEISVSQWKSGSVNNGAIAGAELTLMVATGGGSTLAQGARIGLTAGGLEVFGTRANYAGNGIAYEQSVGHDALSMALWTGGGALGGYVGGLAQGNTMADSLLSATPKPQVGPLRNAPKSTGDLATTPLSENIAGVSDDALVHFSSEAYSVVKPGAGGELFTFRYGDIKHLTPRKLETVIGPAARGGLTGGARVMHVLKKGIGGGTKTPGAVVSEIPEYVFTKPLRSAEAFVVQ